MARWEAGAKGRLQDAALQLFVRHGYEAVTITQIAEAAGLTRRSFFRYFPDKREILFGGSERLAPEIERRLTEGDDQPIGPEEVLPVLGEAGDALLIDRDTQERRRAVIASSRELRERERSKIADVAGGVAAALRHRGTPPADAEILGTVYAEIFRSAYDRALSDPTTSFRLHVAAVARVVGGMGL